LSFMEEKIRLKGIFICPDMYASYLSRKIVLEIQPAYQVSWGSLKRDCS
jgi:hypothetical protein